jgi:Thiamine biosynthesis ATP pyrophosphatase
MQDTEPEETVVVVRYGELFLKSEPVKKRFIGILIDNIRKALEANRLAFRLEHPRGRIIIHGEDSAAIAPIVARIFGVVDTALCVRTGSDPEVLARTVTALATKNLSPGMSFAVRVKREKKEGCRVPKWPPSWVVPSTVRSPASAWIWIIPSMNSR